METKKTENRRYICLVRASDTSDGTTSTAAQLTMLKEYGHGMGMVFVDQIVLDGVSGSLPGKRHDMRDLLTRKAEKNDFDLVILQRLDRLTRGGSVHAFWFEHECQRAGIELLFVGDDIPDGRYANLIKVAKYDAAQEQAFSISQRSTQGAQMALEDGRNITSSHTPFGCWRLYLTANGERSHIIADLRDGRQQKLHSCTLAVIDTYGQIGGGSKGHYRKQKNEKVLLIPGFAHESALVREIFDLHFRNGFGGKGIADVLNRRCVPSPQGKQWSQHQVEVIYEQECYTGRSVGNRSSSAIYHERNPSAPKSVKLDAEIQATAKNIPVRQRSKDEWFIQDQPLMETFLDPELRKLAMAEHQRNWQRRGDANRPKRPKGKHQASDYLLTGLLFAKGSDEPMVGVLCGRVGKKVRYYRHRKGRRGYIKGSLFNRMLNAKPLEKAVVDLVSQMLMNDGSLREAIIAKVEGEMRKASPTDELADLQKRREQIKRKTNLIAATLDEESLADAREELDRLKNERRSVEDQIAAAEAATAMRSVDPMAVADAVMGQLRNMSANINEMPKFALRNLLSAVIGRVVVDLETRAVEIQMMLSMGMMGDLNSAGAMRLVGNSASSISYGTHPTFRIELGKFDCTEKRIGKPCDGSIKRPCYDCRRKAA